MQQIFIYHVRQNKKLDFDFKFILDCIICLTQKSRWCQTILIMFERPPRTFPRDTHVHHVHIHVNNFIYIWFVAIFRIFWINLYFWVHKVNVKIQIFSTRLRTWFGLMSMSGCLSDVHAKHVRQISPCFMIFWTWFSHIRYSREWKKIKCWYLVSYMMRTLKSLQSNPTHFYISIEKKLRP